MLTAIAALAVVILLPTDASLIGSTPSDGDTLTAQPGTVSIVMSDEILTVDGADGVNAMQVTDAEGLFYGDGCLTVAGDTLSLDATLGAAGDYTITYQAASGDGHPVDGTVSFVFAPAAGSEGAPGTENPPVCGEAAEAAEPEATSDAPAATASADQGTGTDESAESDGRFPFIAVGVLVLLGLLAVIAYTVNRGARVRRDRA